MIAFLELRIFRECIGLRRITNQLNSPRGHACVGFGGMISCCESHLFHSWKLARCSDPFLCCSTGYNAHVETGFIGKLAMPFDPILHSSRTCVVGCSCQSQISELLAELTEPACCFIKRLCRFKWIRQTPPTGRAWHKLRNTKRSGSAH